MSSDSILRITISGLDQSNARMRAEAERIRSKLGIPLGRAGDLTVDAARNRIKEEGPGWIRSKRAIRENGTTGYDTGDMLRGIKTEQVSTEDGKGKARVGVSGPAAKYAVWFQTGTGGHGPRGQSFKVSQPARTWKSKGKTFTARGSEYMHGGQPPRPFLFFDDPLRAKIRDVFRDFAINPERASG